MPPWAGPTATTSLRPRVGAPSREGPSPHPAVGGALRDSHSERPTRANLLLPTGLGGTLDGWRAVGRRDWPRPWLNLRKRFRGGEIPTAEGLPRETRGKSGCHHRRGRSDDQTRPIARGHPQGGGTIRLGALQTSVAVNNPFPVASACFENAPTGETWWLCRATGLTNYAAEAGKQVSPKDESRVRKGRCSRVLCWSKDSMQAC